ncbi:hypothetical protein CQ12_26160 [Bradyrhizobium jicamae]|uniref:Glycosyltransferase RgtA/B/C/D-like domain-containing protein n=1 Tax=Bradyrhizobium jicamae TaxID=280332 RepID=A0A0R3L0R9_9BRAD|nr:hypothetical protein [Bradyrhizobium jicamae]KRR01303.1 hypothetical protein CQ12_26160 [Bradyrhizobium jicamae]
MSIDAATIDQAKASSFGRIPVWSWLGAGVYVLFLINGSGLLNDSDTYWQIAVGQWILDHGALPRVDVYSFSKPGEPWISSSWFAQILYAASYNLAGWTGPVVVAAGSIAATFALLAHILERRIPATYAALVALAAMVLSAPHFLARPHVLAMPVMVAWAYGLMTASERGQAPSFWLLPLIALWANLHGGFVFGLVLAGAFAIDAMWNAAPSQRKPLALRWVAFGLAALAACCVTPYGWESILASRKILDLGELLRLISEWAPADFSKLSAFELTILALIAGTLYRGVKLSPPRIALVLGLLHMALSHGRNLEIFALLLPIVVLTPVSQQLALRSTWSGRTTFVPAVVLAVAFGISTWAIAAHQTYSPPKSDSPAAAVEAIKAHNLRRVLNDRALGGYLIWRQIPVFIDGRAELYGEKFTMAYYNALELKDVSQFLDLLGDHDIDALLLRPGAPAATLLDHVGIWRRVYADDVVVLYARGGG